MKTLLFLSVCIFFSTHLLAQKETMGSFLFKGFVYSYNFRQDDVNRHSLKVTCNNKSPLKPDSSRIAFDSFTKDIFSKVFTEHMLKLRTPDTTVSAIAAFRKDSLLLVDKGIELFFQIQAQLLDDDEPITAHFILRKDFVNSYLNRNESPYYTGALADLILEHKIDKVHIETEDGTIKNITVSVTEKNGTTGSSRTPLEFKNLIPISVSAKFDHEFLSKHMLYCINCHQDKVTRFIKLSDLLNIKIFYEPLKDNYSPANRVFDLTPENPIIPVKKEKRSKLFEISTFSDFMGLSNQSPNGLVQIEAKAKISINTNYYLLRGSSLTKSSLANQLDYGSYTKAIRIQDLSALETPVSAYNQNGLITNSKELNEFLAKKDDFDTKKNDYYLLYYKQKTYNTTKSEPVINNLPVKDSSYIDSVTKARIIVKYVVNITSPLVQKIDTSTKEYVTIQIVPKKKYSLIHSTFFNNIEPYALISKLEDKNKYLSGGNLRVSSVRFSPIELLSHQLATVGVKLNIYRVVFQQAKFSLNLIETGAYWLRNKAILKTYEGVDTASINSITYTLGSSLLFRPEGRWGFDLSFNFLHIYDWNPQLVLSGHNWVRQLHFNVFFNTNATSRLFFRLRLNSQVNNYSSNFAQVQVGYLLDIFKGARAISN